MNEEMQYEGCGKPISTTECFGRAIDTSTARSESIGARGRWLKNVRELSPMAAGIPHV
jgi:hypothetical protein